MQTPSPDAALQWRIDWTWHLPVWATVLLTLGVVAWIAMLYAVESAPTSRARRFGLTLLRTAALGLVALMVAQPTVEWFRQGQAPVVLLVDRSASMSTADVPVENGTQSRLEWTQQQATMWLEQWQESHRVAAATFAGKVELLQESDSLEAINAAPHEAGTQLATAIDEALTRAAPQTPAALVLLTDGINTAGGDLAAAARQAQRLGVPVFTVAVGSERPQPDFGLENLLAEQIAFPGDFLQIEANLTARSMAGRQATVTLRNQADNQVLAETKFAIETDEVQKTVRVGFRVTQPGELPLVLSVSSDIAEKNTANNSLQHTLTVSDEQIRVLLVNSAPSYEYRGLASLLSRDPALVLHTFLQEADPEFAEVDRAALATLPATVDELSQYDAIILGDVEPAPIEPSFWKSLEAAVAERSRGLVVIAGPRFMPHAFRDYSALATLLPIDLEVQSAVQTEFDPLAKYQLLPTAVGKNLGMLQLGDGADAAQNWSRLPPITWLCPLARLKPGAQVLVEAQQQAGTTAPAIVRHYVGAGEVLLHATDETWRWKWRSDDRLFARYWGQVARRLGRSRVASQRDGVKLSTDRQQYRPGQRIQLQARFQNPALAPPEAAGVAVEVTGDIQPRRELRLTRRLGYRGTFQHTLQTLPPDRYAARVISPLLAQRSGSITFEVTAPPGELARTAVDKDALKLAAQISGGKFYTTDTADQLTAGLPSPRKVQLESLPSEPLWNSHWVIAILLTILTTEWILRRRAAML